jgi:GNAT superfamily N-acetyltransferase
MEDLPDILQLYSQPDLDNGKVLPLTEAREIFEKIHAHPNYKIYVGCSGDKIVGTFALLIMDNLAHMGARSAIIEDLVVAAEWQRMGIGSQIIHSSVFLGAQARASIIHTLSP